MRIERGSAQATGRSEEAAGGGANRRPAVEQKAERACEQLCRGVK